MKGIFGTTFLSNYKKRQYANSFHVTHIPRLTGGIQWVGGFDLIFSIFLWLIATDNSEIDNRFGID